MSLATSAAPSPALPDHPALAAASRASATRPPVPGRSESAPATQAPPAPPAPRPQRTRAAKATCRHEVKPSKLSFYLSPETARRLGVASVMEGRSQSAIVEQLLSESLRRWVVQDRGKSNDPAMVEESAN